MHRTEQFDLAQLVGNGERLPSGKKVLDIDLKITHGFDDYELRLIDFSKQNPADMAHYLRLKRGKNYEWAAVLTEEGEPVIALVDEPGQLNLSVTRVVNLHPQGEVGVIKPLGRFESETRKLSNLVRNSLVIPYQPDGTPLYLAKVNKNQSSGFKYLISVPAAAGSQM